MSNGSGGPHGVKVEYENVKFTATEDTKLITVEVKTEHGSLTTKISMDTGKVVSQS